MAITIVEERKTQKYLAVIFVILVVAIAFVFFSKFFRKEEIAVPSILPPTPSPRIEIKFQVLENPVLDELSEPFPELPSLSSQDIPETIGRQNPFAPVGAEIGEGIGE